MKQTSTGPTRQYAALIGLLALAGMGQVMFTVDAVRDMTGHYAYQPVLFSTWPSVGQVVYAKSGAAVKRGDRVVEVNGQAAASRATFAQAVRTAHPGDTLTLTFERSGARQTIPFKLVAAVQHPTAFFWVFSGVSWIFMPWLCIVLGFWVGFLRPRDLRAWLLMGMMLGFSQVNRPGILDPLGWPGAMGATGWVYGQLAQLAWPVCMMLFAFYFPQRWRFDIAAPWFKWALLGPLVLISLWGILWEGMRNLGAGLQIPRPPISNFIFVPLTMAVLAMFFIALSDKWRNSSLPPDERRRVRLLYFGASAAMTPAFLLLMYTLIFLHRTPGDQDGIWLVIGIIAMAIFPLTTAYVIVVHRAMDVRVVIRQGVQYALARRGVRVLQGILIVGVVSSSVWLMDTHQLTRANRFTVLAIGIVLAVRIRELGEKVRVWVDRRFFREAYNAEQILSALSEQVRGILDSESLLETVARKISESLHVDRIAVLLQQDGMFRPALALGYPAPIDISMPAETPPLEALRQRQPVPVDPEQSETGFRTLDSQLLLPLASHKELLGFISLGPKRSEEPYSPSDTNLLRTVAAQTGLALENARLSAAIASEVAQRELLHREIEIAREVQQRLFPQSLPEVISLEYAGHCRPAQGVGGDYYDFLALTSGRLGIAIGDVSGKGVPAALLMASLQASVRGQSLSDPGRVAELMSNVNKLVCDASADNRYATFFYGQFDPETRRLVYTNGGHNAPMLLRGDRVLRLETGGPPVGLFRLLRYEQEAIQLETGDLLVFYTDGISEAENAAQEEWGEEALIATARACDNEPASAVIDKIMRAADAFAAGAPQHDDMTLVIARVL